MRTYTQKQSQPHKPLSSSLSRSNMATPHRLYHEHPILNLQGAIGNQSVPQTLLTDIEELKAELTGTATPRFGHNSSLIPLHPSAAGAIQTKLAINKPGDEYEQEADRLSEQVIRMPEPQQLPACPCVGGCPKCHAKQPGQEYEHLQTKRIGSNELGQPTAPPIVNEVLASPGQPLDMATRAFFEPRFGYDFSRVRVHTDRQAAQSAEEVKARAYTVGQHVVFGSGKYAPGTNAGNRLIAHELVHTMQQGSNVVRRQDEACTTRFIRARSFPAFIDLIREAETRLITAGYTSVEDRIHVLRGIYYGTTWSADYGVERSTVRNIGFQAYTASNLPDDPRPHLGCGLFEALRDSQDLIDGGRQVDVGHLIIGLDARRSRTARDVTIPTQGGTGLDISTWLGDLGGGAGTLALRRVSRPNLNAMSMFRGTDFGGPINLEGDVAGFVVARNTSTTPSQPVDLTFARSSTIADALADYLLPTTSGPTSSEWNNRCRTFMQMKGATFNTSRALTNRTTLIRLFKGQIEQFACWYLVNRLRQSGRLRLSTLRTASLHISGSSEEIATIFVDALNACQSTPGSNLAATGSGPAASAIGKKSPTACNLAISALETAAAAENLLERGQTTLRDLQHRAWELLREEISF